MFTYKTKIRLHDTDAAGILFFSHQFEIIHDAYECVLEQMGFGFAELIKKKNFFLPIVHAESDYKAPLYVGDKITVEVILDQVGTSSFSFAYRIIKEGGLLVGTARTVHVTIDNKSRKKISLPAAMKKEILKIYQRDKKG